MPDDVRKRAMNVREICSILDELAPPGLAYSWDRAGLHTGDPDSDVARVLVALSVELDTLRAAKRRKAQMIVAHHPLIWSPLASLRRDDPQAALCLALSEAGIACYSAHTNLDIVPGGVSHRLGELLQLEAVRPLFQAEHAALVKLVTFVPARYVDAVRTAVCSAGAGNIGEYTFCTFSTPGMGTFRPGSSSAPFIGRKGVLNEEPEVRFETLVPRVRLAGVLEAMRAAHPYEEPAYDIVTLENRDPEIGLGVRGSLRAGLPLARFAGHVISRLNCGHVRIIGDRRRKVKHVAVIGGSGGSELQRIPEDVDVVVTGDVKYHEGIEARRRGIAIVDAGHDVTERPIVPVLADFLRKRCRGVRVYGHDEPPLFEVLMK